MAKYTIKETGDKQKWERFVINHKVSSFLQSWSWGEVNKSMGNKIFRLGVYEDGKMVGVCLAISIRAKSGSHLLIPGGPILNWNNKRVFKLLIDYLKKLAVAEKVWFIRIRPEIINNIENTSLFKKNGFIESPIHVHAENTWILDISKSEEELLYGMRKSTRYLIRKSLGLGLKVYKSVDLKKIEGLARLQDETSKRHKFVGFPIKLFKAELQNFSSDNQALLFSCMFKDKLLASAIIIFYGDSAYYHFSGSTTDHGNIPYSYFLQWEIIKEAKRRNCKYYNFWGIAPNNNPKHRFHGVTTFKTGFGGNRIDWLHAKDLVISPLYYLTRIFELFRKKTRNL